MIDYNNWNNESYKNFIKHLSSFEDLKYKEFHSRLIKDSNLIGIRTADLKDISKQIAKGDYKSFIALNKHDIYEEKFIHGQILGYIKTFDKTLFMDFLKHVDNWAICDQTIANIKWFKKNKEDGLKIVLELLNSSNFWSKRVGFVILLDYYISDEYLNMIFNYVDNDNSDEYYVKMAKAWLISMCYIKYPKETESYLKVSKMDDFTYNKAIQKTRESFRIDKETKIKLEKLKRKSI